ncbi:hypothetical protein RHECNPAF_850064 [Rhizobium etli CNPAF512]|nr:hypothetical protein RHECNPAF_850064 [Rhizobium etli CNPAF512]
MLLVQEAGRRQQAVADHLDDGDDGGRGRPSDRRAAGAGNLDRIIGAHELLAAQAAILRPFGGDMDIDDIVFNRRLGIGQDLAGECALVAHQELMEEEVHQLHMAGVTHGLVVEIVDLAEHGVAHGAKPARGGEGFELDAADIDRLMPFHRRDQLAHTALDDLAIIQIFVDDAFRRPVECIAEKAGRMLRQGADAHADRAAAIEAVGEACTDDADETRRQAALRRHQAAGGLRQFDDEIGGRNVFGQIEIMDAGKMGGAGQFDVQMVGKAGEHRLDRGEQFTNHLGIGDIAGAAPEGQIAQRQLRIDADDLEAAFMQQRRRQPSDLAQAENGNLFETHAYPPTRPLRRFRFCPMRAAPNRTCTGWAEV